MSDDTPLIRLYWRPGCGFCMRLERQLGPYDLPIERHDIWEDPDAAATVRDVARGNETVPTVFVGDHAMVNPSADQVLRVVRDEAPELLPADWEPAPPSRVSQAVARLLGS